MNLYEASIDGSTLQLGSQSLTLDPSLFERLTTLKDYDGKRVIAGIRPEDFEDIALADSADQDRRLVANVTLTEALGSEIMVHFELDATTVDSGDPDAVEETGADAVGRFNPRSRVRAGEVAEIAVATENMHFFDQDTRLRIA